MKRILGLAVAALGLLFTLPANARTPIGPPLMSGTWELKLSATCTPADGSGILKDKGTQIVTVTDVPMVAPPTASDITMTGFTVDPNGVFGGFVFDAMTGVRYGEDKKSGLLLFGNTDSGTLVGTVKISNGVGTNLKATASNVDAIGLIQVKIKGKRIGP